MCQSFLLNASFWFNLSQLDRSIADQVQSQGCPHCTGKLHVANYPRKPRGERRAVLGPDYTRRLSFCCSQCRKRTTPPSVRFLGRKVYLGSIIVALLVHLSSEAGNANLMTPGLMSTLAEHAMGNPRILCATAAELLAAAARQESEVLDEKLYLEHFSAPKTKVRRKAS